MLTFTELFDAAHNHFRPEDLKEVNGTHRMKSAALQRAEQEAEYWRMKYLNLMLEVSMRRGTAAEH